MLYNLADEMAELLELRMELECSTGLIEIAMMLFHLIG